MNVMTIIYFQAKFDLYRDHAIVQSQFSAPDYSLTAVQDRLKHGQS